MTFDNLLGYILSISMRMQKFIKISQTVSELSTFLTNRPGQNLHKLSGDKIKCLIIGHSRKFNFKFQLTFLGLCNRFKRYVRVHNFFTLTTPATTRENVSGLCENGTLWKTALRNVSVFVRQIKRNINKYILHVLSIKLRDNLYFSFSISSPGFPHFY